MIKLKKFLEKYPKTAFVAWCVIASFGSYFCMYAFRKPFNTGTYESYHLWGMDYKAILIITQVFGYMLSKFIGIKIIAELKPHNRIKLIIGLILMAELALLGFATVPFPYNFVFLFLNGLPLGMVWGIVFSFLEGRRFTEVLVFGLSISVIVASGVLKTIYLQVSALFPMISEFWMPFTMGAIFLPLFVLFVWMLSVIPPPSEEDKLMKTERVPMDDQSKKKAVKFFGLGLTSMIIIYALLTTLRDFRDNFSVEIWNEIDPGWNMGILSITELIAGIIVLGLMGLIALIKNNKYGFWATTLMIFFGLLGSGLATLFFQLGLISPFSWMCLIGVFMFMAYTPIQTIFFDKMLALYQYRANAGFFIYICDAIGYLSSVTLLLYKEFFITEMNWSNVLIYISYSVTIIGLLMLGFGAYHFRKTYSKQDVESLNRISLSQPL